MLLLIVKRCGKGGRVGDVSTTFKGIGNSLGTKGGLDGFLFVGAIHTESFVCEPRHLADSEGSLATTVTTVFVEEFVRHISVMVKNAGRFRDKGFC
jgi:hypothetical protein